MGKGEVTRQGVLERAAILARAVGLEGLTIGKLSEELKLSKSGLFAHFRSKENLQIEVIAEGRRQFVEQVVRPAIRKPRGEPRVRALFDQWMKWGKQEGGCLFVAASAELDDRVGMARDEAVAAQRAWFETLDRAARLAVDEGHFRRELDTRQFAFELQGIMFGFHFHHRFLRQPDATTRARRAFESLLELSRRTATQP